MADEPDDLVLVMLPDIRAKLDGLEQRLERIEDDQNKFRREISGLGRGVTIALGQSTKTQYEGAEQATRIDELFTKLEELLSDPPSH